MECKGDPFEGHALRIVLEVFAGKVDFEEVVGEVHVEEVDIREEVVREVFVGEVAVREVDVGQVVGELVEMR